MKAALNFQMFWNYERAVDIARDFSYFVKPHKNMTITLEISGFIWIIARYAGFELALTPRRHVTAWPSHIVDTAKCIYVYQYRYMLKPGTSHCVLFWVYCPQSSEHPSFYINGLVPCMKPDLNPIRAQLLSPPTLYRPHDIFPTFLFSQFAVHDSELRIDRIGTWLLHMAGRVLKGLRY